MKIKINANSHETLTQVGNYLRILDSGEKVRITVYFHDGSSRFNWLESGMAWRTDQEFLKIEVYSESTQTVEYVTAFGEVSDSRIFGQIKTTEQGGQLSGLPVLNFDVNAKQIAENINRRELHIKAADTNTGAVWIGTTATGAGLPLEAGDMAVLQVNKTLDLYADTLTDKVYLLELV